MSRHLRSATCITCPNIVFDNLHIWGDHNDHCNESNVLVPPKCLVVSVLSWEFCTIWRRQEPLGTYKSFLKKSNPSWHTGCDSEQDAREESICSRIAWTKIYVFKYSRMVSMMRESNGVSKTHVAWSHVGPRITFFWFSKAGSPGRGARYERHDNAFAFPCCLPWWYVILISKLVSNRAHRAGHVITKYSNLMSRSF